MSLPVHLVDPEVDGVLGPPGTSYVLTGDEAHHAVAVRRVRVGEEVVLTDGRGTRAVVEVSATGKRSLTVEIVEREVEVEPGPRLVVVQALPKGDRGELAVELLTEIGVARVVPWAAARSVAVWKGERATKSLARWRSTAREAAKQSRRSWHPQVDPLASTADVVALVGGADLALVLHEDAERPLAEVAGRAPGPREVVVVVGPEGGLDPTELEALTGAGAHAVRLGREVLRTSTAGLAACAALLAQTPRWATRP